MPPTKRGIYHNLKESNYTVSNGEIIFFFSSKVYRKKFLDGYAENRKLFMEKIRKLKLETPFNMETLSDIEFYKEVEKRGFRAMLKGVDISCEDLHRIYALRKMIEKNTLDWSEIQKPKLGERLKIME